MNIAVIGRTEMLYDAAELLAQAGHRIKLIVTAREAPEYRRGTEDYRRLAAEVGAGFFTTTKINGKIDTIKEYLPIDMAISMNYVNVIGQDVIDMFPRGILNAHAGDLPRYRGNACVTWAIINGEPRVGLCIHKMVGGQLDTGDIIERDYHPVNIDTKVGEVLAWMGKRVPRMFLDAAAKLEENPGYILEKQNTDPTAGLRCYPRQPGDGEID